MKAELKPAMIAVAACAHALDALYAELAEHVGPETLAQWEQTRRGGRSAEIAGVLELSANADVDEWRPRLRKLFEALRNPAIHPKAKARRLLSHPVLPTNVPPEYAIYCVEAVEESVDLLLAVLSTCVAAPRAAVATWANDARGVVDQLVASRAAKLGLAKLGFLNSRGADGYGGVGEPPDRGESVRSSVRSCSAFPSTT